MPEPVLGPDLGQNKYLLVLSLYHEFSAARDSCFTVMYSTCTVPYFTVQWVAFAILAYFSFDTIFGFNSQLYVKFSKNYFFHGTGESRTHDSQLRVERFTIRQKFLVIEFV